MKEFKVGSIYCTKIHYGVGYDGSEYENYYLITRKSDTTIWFRKQTICINRWGDKTNEKFIPELMKEMPEMRSKLRNDDNGEWFKDKSDEWVKFPYFKELDK